MLKSTLVIMSPRKWQKGKPILVHLMYPQNVSEGWRLVDRYLRNGEWNQKQTNRSSLTFRSSPTLRAISILPSSTRKEGRWLEVDSLERMKQRVAFWLQCTRHRLRSGCHNEKWWVSDSLNSELCRFGNLAAITLQAEGRISAFKDNSAGISIPKKQPG